MANFHCARVCMIGSETDMTSLCRILLQNYGEDPEDEDFPVISLNELIQKIRDISRLDGAESDTFLYQMISTIRYGDATPGTLRLEIKEQPCGLWSACFAYESSSPFQVHEWLNLHRRAGQILTVIQRASWDFGTDKGEVILTAGQVLDNWNCMGECWLWLVHRYEYGYPPEEAVDRLKKLEKTLEREEYDMTIDELLQSCEDNLKAIALMLQDPEDILRQLTAYREQNDFPALTDLQHAVAQSVLWDTDRNARWLATLQAVRQLWQERGL